ncbi:TPA: copper/silver-translocating P-type ATPase CopB [Enterococcus faecium]|uniref:copper/silver-translocating P-type ATPase CopB n=1 Tax=Enterococcus faecium TaxID=1352 RepID=UPI000B2FD63E|nr:copper/silver-translocating P-type ATPase CopB [Enterococcus faecium]MDW7859130.1 copper/silver-translocating P-type ATPase CopB [Enterococcus faecium]MDW7894028.1 copper/silver-translocating P-type ATPase CopB [Enterococcus faecium]HAP8391412.1 copper/silver-translocating P-type ATPase CopB [Enterococcus faecium]HAQ0039877.1 copper/silver-translocating P-type ATPase CopB [Enterococcus faecium]HAQ0178859.1 copper/silver-translocating P-type ATPase CopB [Enterococcus faecium]
MNGNDMEKKHEHKKEVVNKESTESHEKQMEMKHDHSQMDHSMHMGHNHGDIANSKQMDHSMHMDHEHGGMDHSMHMGNFKQKFWLSLILAIPIILFSPMMGMEFPFQVTFPGSDWLVLILATILFIYGGQPFLSGAKMELKQKSPAMMTLIAMGITVAYIYSVYSFIANLLNPHTHVMDFFWELATLIVIMLLGHWIEMNAVSNASNALQKLAELLPESVKRLTKDGKEETVSLKEVNEGDRLIVRSGDKMPTDGVILKGETIVDESAVTGESRGIKKQANDKVIGGSINGNGTIEIEVTGTGENGYLAKVMEMVRKAQGEKSKLESLSDKVAKWLFYVALIVGILAFIAWLFLTDLPNALERMVTVFIIACPHALGLAIPLVVARSTSIAAKNGLLLKNRNALEQANDLDVIMLDKTGTLTEGKFTVTGVEVLDDAFNKNEILQYLGALEANANHPLAVGIMNYLKEHEIKPYQAENLKNLSGVGLEATVKKQQVKIVNEKEVERLGLNVEQALLKPYQEQGNTISFLILENHLAAIVALGDVVKTEAKEFIRTLKERKITPVMLTGDNKNAAQAVADYLGIEEYYGGLLPDDKEAVVQKYLDQGKKVIMVGDGINDAPSLARASIGMAIGAGTDIAIDSADVVLTNSDPKDILHFLDLAKQTRKKMIQNLWWGAGYNILAIPLAAGILAPIGIILSPAVGAVLMSLSTVVVALNALTLKIK